MVMDELGHPAMEFGVRGIGVFGALTTGLASIRQPGDESRLVEANLARAKKVSAKKGPSRHSGSLVARPTRSRLEFLTPAPEP